MRRLKFVVAGLAALLFFCLLFAPLLQLALPRGVLVSREATSGWASGFAQIAFALVAAFLVFLLPQVVEVGRFRLQWAQRNFYYSHFPPPLRSGAFDLLCDALCDRESRAPGTLPKLIVDWTETRQKSAGTAMSDADSDAAIRLFASEFHETILSNHHWKLLFGSAQAQQGASSETDHLRQLLLSTICIKTLRNRQRILATVLVMMIVISLGFGTLALAPDPFFYVSVASLIQGRFPLQEDYRYPELALWLVACAFIIDTFFLALWFWLEVYTVHLSDPENFPET